VRVICFVFCIEVKVPNFEVDPAIVCILALGPFWRNDEITFKPSLHVAGAEMAA
jgi:hypothetical protein